MKKTILIAPFEGPLAAALAREARAAGWSVAIARGEPARAEPARPAPLPPEAQQAPEASDLVALPWNPASYISASALALGARNALGELDAAILLSEAESLRVDLVGARPGEVDTALQRAVLGPALLSRELVRGFEARRGGSLLLMERETAARPSGPAAGLAAGAFHGLGEGLFDAAREAAWKAFGVIDKGESPDEAARFAIRLLDDDKGGKSGRWLRFTGKAGLFGIFQQ